MSNASIKRLVLKPADAHYVLKVLTAGLLLGALAFPCSAQTFGAITGQVEDPSGAVVAGAAVTLTNADTNVTRQSATNDSGIYTFRRCLRADIASPSQPRDLNRW